MLYRWLSKLKNFYSHLIYLLEIESSMNRNFRGGSITLVVELSLVKSRELLRGSAFGGDVIVGLNT